MQGSCHSWGLIKNYYLSVFYVGGYYSKIVLSLPLAAKCRGLGEISLWRPKTPSGGRRLESIDRSRLENESSGHTLPGGP